MRSVGHAAGSGRARADDSRRQRAVVSARRRGRVRGQQPCSEAGDFGVPGSRGPWQNSRVREKPLVRA